ncbi:3722_t:CDS:2, partial [Paraglomus occultum]
GTSSSVAFRISMQFSSSKKAINIAKYFLTDESSAVDALARRVSYGEDTFYKAYDKELIAALHYFSSASTEDDVIIELNVSSDFAQLLDSFSEQMHAGPDFT